MSIVIVTYTKQLYYTSTYYQQAIILPIDNILMVESDLTMLQNSHIIGYPILPLSHRSCSTAVLCRDFLGKYFIVAVVPFLHMKTKLLFQPSVWLLQLCDYPYQAMQCWKEFMQWELIYLSKLYQHPTKCFTSMGRIVRQLQ